MAERVALSSGMEEDVSSLHLSAGTHSTHLSDLRGTHNAGLFELKTEKSLKKKKKISNSQLSEQKLLIE